MTRVALLWHMHQPFYEDLVTGEHILPWVRLHALKDYWGMVALLREFPGIRLTVNLVPSLLVQLEAFAREEARDRHLELGLKPAASLSEDEREFCVQQFFHAHRRHMVDPFPRYAELLARRVQGAAAFSVDDLRDLQVWHKLVWIDQLYVEGDPRVRALVEKGEGYDEDDKHTLRAIELELLRRVIPEYREASARGQVELSTSPFYHPILPLLCDSDVHLRAHPGSRMPREPFRHPEDAAEQISRAVAYHERLFGTKPAGLWPSEGSVSDGMIPLVAQAGFRWMATDEEILARSLDRGLTRDAAGEAEQPEVLYRPYLVGRGTDTVACGFRDHTLSDLIGFTYASWAPEAAAADFVHRLASAGERYAARTRGEAATIFIILDGENAWEYYPGQGRPFLRAFYSHLAAHPALRTVTMSEACEAGRELLPSVFPGSWINGDFYIWIGHADDHRAWSQLADARHTLESPPVGLPAAALARAREELLIAEGSDWFWWYGDDHSSDHDLEFDELFRRHLRNVYRALERPIPEELFVTNITTQTMDTQVHPPAGLVSPDIDGEVGGYFEWIGAGYVDVSRQDGAMHQVSERGPAIRGVEFGFDLRHLYLRVDGTAPMTMLLDHGLDLTVRFLEPSGVRVVIRAEGGGRAVRLLRRDHAGQWTEVAVPGLVGAVGTVAELKVPFAVLGLGPRDSVVFFVAVTRGAAEIEHHPQHRPIEVQVPGHDFAARHWSA